MGLIKIKKLGFGIGGNILDLIIAIPKDRYIEKFWVANQNDITKENSTKVGLEYMEACKRTETNMSKVTAFKKVFTEKDSYTDENGTQYCVYELNQNCNFNFGNTSSTGIFISQNNIIYLTLQLNLINNLNPNPSGGESIPQYLEWYPPQNCASTDDSILVVPLYNVNALRVYALAAAKNFCNSCEIPYMFIDRILQIKTIELCLSAGNYFRASVFWNKFFKNKHIVTNSKCICHGNFV